MDVFLNENGLYAKGQVSKFFDILIICVVQKSMAIVFIKTREKVLISPLQNSEMASFAFHIHKCISLYTQLQI